MSNSEPQQPLHTGLGAEPNLSAEFAPRCTWGDKKRFCEMEASTYYGDDVPITENPYHENTWTWKWFNNEYHRLESLG